jgi:PKD repeat protein
MKLKRILLMSFICGMAGFVSAQSENKSILQEQSEEYSKYNLSTPQQWDSLFIAQNPGMTRNILPKERNNCTLDKVVYGWNPYWAGSTYLNYQWNLLSHLCHFSYEIDYADGTANSTHNWATDDAVDSALANGVKVDLCLTLFSNHGTFLANSTATQTLITNVIGMLQSRGGNGVNLDFEGMASSCKADFTAFVTTFSNQLHAAIPGSELSIAMPSVDWSPSEFDLPAIIPYVDMFIIMGYDYYYSGSTIAGPTDPLYNFLTSYNYTLTKSVTYYLNAGVPSAKLILGLPYYGKQWATTDNSVGSSTTASGTSPFYNTVRANASGNYTTKLWNSNSFTPYYPFQISTQWYQCWIDDAYSLGKRFDMVNQRGIGGIGIWALGYDDGYTELWDKITDKFSSCAVVNCVDTIYDMGGPGRNYYDNENYTYTIQPSGATAVQLVFNSFSVTNDTLWLYDGASTASPLIGTYTLTNSPGTITSTSNALTLKFRSRASTNSTGWDAIWTCITDNTPPTTLVNVNGNWQTQDFTANFTDADVGTGVEKRFYEVSDFNGTEWTANAQNGFFFDEFNSLNSSVWTIPASSGTWSVNGGNLLQTDSAVSNTNIYAALDQNNDDIFLYHFNAKIENAVYAANQRRFGFHFFCDDASQTNRGNSYFIYFRQETSKLEFYKVVSNSFTQEKVIDNVILSPGQWYNFKVMYDRNSGKIDVYRDDIFLGTWIDPSPYTANGNYISFRTGNCNATINDIEVFHSRVASEQVSVGSAGTNDIRYQNTNPSSPSARIFSIVADAAGLLSETDTELVDVDWTPPSLISEVNDGISADIDTTSIITSISANFSKSLDPNSDIAHYEYCFGTTPGGAELIGWTNNGIDTAVIRSGFTLQNGLTYYFSAISVDGAGLLSDTAISDGVYIRYAPVAGFTTSTQVFCKGDTVQYTNTSTSATSYLWNFPGGNPASSPQENPLVAYNTIGTFDVSLYAYGPGGSDTISVIAYIYVNPAPQASFSAIDTLVYLPSADVVFSNSSSNASAFYWDFGDGTTSTDQNPWHSYNTAGVYTVMLIASNTLCGDDALILTDYIHVESGVGIYECQDYYYTTIYPVPSTNDVTLYITLDETDKMQIGLLDVTGKYISDISNGTFNKGKHKFSISKEKLNLKCGTYFIRIKGSKGNQYLRFIFE